MSEQVVTKETVELVQKLWDFHHVNQPLKEADCILVLCSSDLRVAEHGAKLFQEKWAPLLVFSGGLGRITKDRWKEPEADKFAKVALEMGIPKEKILIENKSTNTGENITFTRKLLLEKGFDPKKLIVVQKPYMERRVYATFMKQWPGKEIVVSTPKISLKNYPTKELPLEKVINIVFGDIQRIKIYAEKGFQIPQEIPVNVWEAYENLVEMGYDEYVLN